jgi:hypothetical protein
MKTLISAMALAVGLLASLPVLATDVGVSVQVSRPGVYGRIDIGRFPQPQVVVQQPVIVAQPAVVVAQPQPVYMWVPPGHRMNWRKHCGRYNACGVPVYFVQQQWYHQHVMPARDDRGHDRRGRGHGHGRVGKHRD